MSQSEWFDLGAGSLSLAKLRLPFRVIAAALASAALVIGILPWIHDLALILSSRPIAGSQITTLPIALGTGVLVLVLGTWVSVWGMRRVAVALSLDDQGVTFIYRGGRTRTIPWVRAKTNLRIFDWRDSAQRRGIAPTLALSARWGPFILAILTPEAFSRLVTRAQEQGLHVLTSGVNRWVTGSPLSTVVYRFS